MTPLDLSKERPRRATDASAGGIVFLARTIDKVRGQLPGGALGQYFVTSPTIQTVSGALFRRFGIDEAEFCDVVRDAPDEKTVVDWVLARTNPETIAKWNARIGGHCIEHLGEADKQTLKTLSPTTASLPEGTPILEALDREDDVTWA